MHPGPGAETPPPRGGRHWLADELQRSCSPDWAYFFSKRAVIPASSCPSGPRVGVTCTEPDINM
jgi:hypothetical protein